MFSSTEISEIEPMDLQNLQQQNTPIIELRFMLTFPENINTTYFNITIPNIKESIILFFQQASSIKELPLLKYYIMKMGYYVSMENNLTDLYKMLNICLAQELEFQSEEISAKQLLNQLFHLKESKNLGLIKDIYNQITEMMESGTTKVLLNFHIDLYQTRNIQIFTKTKDTQQGGNNHYIKIAFNYGRVNFVPLISRFDVLTEDEEQLALDQTQDFIDYLFKNNIYKYLLESNAFETILKYCRENIKILYIIVKQLQKTQILSQFVKANIKQICKWVQKELTQLRQKSSWPDVQNQIDQDGHLVSNIIVKLLNVNEQFIQFIWSFPLPLGKLLFLYLSPIGYSFVRVWTNMLSLQFKYPQIKPKIKIVKTLILMMEDLTQDTRTISEQNTFRVQSASLRKMIKEFKYYPFYQLK